MTFLNLRTKVCTIHNVKTITRQDPKTQLPVSNQVFSPGNVSDHTVEVTFVDYGNTQTIPKSKLREPALAVPNISRLPFQVLEI